MQKLIRAVICAFVFSIAFHSCVQAPSVARRDGETNLPPEIRKAVQALIDETIKREGVAGYSVGLLHNGAPVFKTHGGFANIEHQVPISENSRYQIYSASKLFFNIALLQMVERGTLDPEAPLSRYLDDLPAQWAALTIRQTWSHMTGVTDILDLTGMEPTAQEALQSVANIPLEFTPGTQTGYSQTNYLLLKNVFEAITGRAYQDYLKQDLFAPLGLVDIPLGDLSLVAPDLTTNYEPHEFEKGRLGRRSLKFPPYVYTSAGINITLDEFMIWWRAVLDGHYVKQETLKTFWAPVLHSDGSQSSRANGWERQHENGLLRIGHGGGARIHLFHYVPDEAPETSVTVFFLTNGGAVYFDHRKFGDALARTVLEGGG